MWIRSFAAALLALATGGAVLANEVQFHVCAAGQNLGEAYARTQYFNGLLGPDQSAEVALNLANAAAHIEVAEAGVQQPFATSPERKRSMSELQGKLLAFARNAEGRSPEARMSMIQGFYTHYLNALAITYVSSRPDAFRWTSTCDSAMLEANWHLGRAATYAAVRFDGGGIEEIHARSNQGGANGSAYQAIRKGLSLATDGISPPPLVACFFNTEAAWSVVPMLRPDEAHLSYVELLPKVLEVCRGAGPHHAPGHHVTVPAVVGLALAEAKRRLAEAGLAVQLAPGSPAPAPAASGTVEAQSAGAGTQVAAGSTVRLTVHSPYVVPPAPPPVPPPAPTAVATRRAVAVYDLAGSYAKGRIRVTLENGRYVGRNYSEFDDEGSRRRGLFKGIVMFEVAARPEEVLFRGIPYSAHRGRCLDSLGERATYAECVVRPGYGIQEPRPMEIRQYVSRGGELVSIDYGISHDTYVYPQGKIGTAEP